MHCLAGNLAFPQSYKGANLLSAYIKLFGSQCISHHSCQVRLILGQIEASHITKDLARTTIAQQVFLRSSFNIVCLVRSQPKNGSLVRPNNKPKHTKQQGLFGIVKSDSFGRSRFPWQDSSCLSGHPFLSLSWRNAQCNACAGHFDLLLGCDVDFQTIMGSIGFRSFSTSFQLVSLIISGSVVPDVSGQIIWKDELGPKVSQLNRQVNFGYFREN